MQSFFKNIFPTLKKLKIQTKGQQYTAPLG